MDLEYAGHRLGDARVVMDCASRQAGVIPRPLPPCQEDKTRHRASAWRSNGPTSTPDSTYVAPRDAGVAEHVVLKLGLPVAVQNWWMGRVSLLGIRIRAPTARFAVGGSIDGRECEYASNRTTSLTQEVDILCQMEGIINVSFLCVCSFLPGPFLSPFTS